MISEFKNSIWINLLLGDLSKVFMFSGLIFSILLIIIIALVL